MQDLLKRAFDMAIDDVSIAQRSVTHKITTDAVDRYQEVILPGGINLKAYRANPVVLFDHGMSYRMPIGRNLWIKPTANGRGLVAKTVFAPTDLGEELFSLYRQEFMKAWSVGLRESEPPTPPTPKEVQARNDMAGCKRVYRKTELVEYSACSIGVNPEALTDAVGKGLELSDLVIKSLGFDPRCPAEPKAEAEPEPVIETTPELPRLGPCRTFGQVHRSLLESLRGQSDPEVVARLVRDRLDLAKGRV